MPNDQIRAEMGYGEKAEEQRKPPDALDRQQGKRKVNGTR
jgi:hypothetical protein